MAAFSDSARDEAVAWFHRLQDPRMGEEAWREYSAWLETDPQNRVAYDAVEAVWLGFEPLPQAEVVTFPRRRQTPPAWSLSRRAIAAGLALAVVGAGILAYERLKPVPIQTYATGPGEVRTIALADGSRVILDRGSTLKVALGPRLRSVELTQGEANFAVSHDAARPFVVTADSHRVQVVGTEFDVLRQPERLQVTVSHGEVIVGPAATQAVDFRLHPGDQFEKRAGRAARVRRIDVSAPAGWRNGLLVYQDAPLADVAGDLTRYLGVPVRLTTDAAALRFNGVLRLSDGPKMLDRLEAFIDVDATPDGRGVLIRRRPDRP